MAVAPRRQLAAAEAESLDGDCRTRALHQRSKELAIAHTVIPQKKHHTRL